MARAKAKSPKLTLEVNVIDEIYLETDDFLRTIKLEEFNVDEELSRLECLLKEKNDKKDPNRSVFHVAPSLEYDLSVDEIRKQIHEQQEIKKSLQDKILQCENRLTALHSVKKILYKADTPEVEFSAAEILPTEPAVKNEMPAYAIKDLIEKLDSLSGKIELSERFITFDPERSKIELQAVKDSISETVNRIKEFTC